MLARSPLTVERKERSSLILDRSCMMENEWKTELMKEISPTHFAFLTLVIKRSSDRHMYALYSVACACADESRTAITPLSSQLCAPIMMMVSTRNTRLEQRDIDHPIRRHCLIHD